MSRSSAQTAGRRGYYSRYIAHYTKKHYGLLAMGVLFVVGVLLGTLLLRSVEGEALDFLLRMVGSFVDNRRDQSLLQNFVSSMTSSLVFVGILFVCGFCAIAQPLIVFVPLFRGLGVGFSTASLYASHGTAAIGYVALLMLPGAVLTTLAILVCGRESLRLSSSLLAGMGKERREGEGYSVRIYLARYVACALLCVASAFLEAILYFAFANFFYLG